MRNVARITAGALALAQVSCASSPKSVEPMYVSPTKYDGWECPRLANEEQRLSTEVTRVSALQQESANTDTAMVAMGVIVFLPLLAVLATTKDREDELARLKGEHTAVYETIAVKQCDRQPALLEASGSMKTESTTVAAEPARPAATAPIETPAKAAPPTDPNEMIVCQEATVVLSRTRAACESAGGLVI